jgi:hypothetical protein
MTINLKDVAGVAKAGADIRTRLVLIAAGATLAGIAALALANHYEVKGRELERADWLAKELQRDQANAALERKHQAEMAVLTLTHQQIERKTTHDHQTELAALRRDRAADRAAADRNGGLRIPAPACPAGGAVARTETPGAGGRDETGARTVALPEQTQDDLWAIVNDADEVSAQLRACQSWVRANGFYGPPPAESGALLDRMIASPNQPTAPEEPHG